VISSLMT